jgi:hypothetical protein
VNRAWGIIVLFVAAVAFVAVAAPAFGWAEGGVTFEGNLMDCPACHQAELFFPDRVGPHGGYTTATTKCAVCHTVHAATDGSYKLLPGPTVLASCRVCHDGTGGYGVYGTIAKRNLTVGATHSIDTTNVIPGGDASTGGSASRTFGGVAGTMTCDDCHSPHAANVVAAFSGERIRFHASDLGWITTWSTSKLLKQKPTGATLAVAEYGSDWCLACHAGRVSGGSVHNHPVDSVTTTPTPYVYDRAAIVTADNALTTTIGTLGLLGFPPGQWHNRGFVMPYPRTTDQQGHNPICQQCHEDTRVVGEPGAVVPAQIERYGDGLTDGDVGIDNPLFQGFPHETQNDNMLVETGDNLCLNCHPVGSLP